MGKRKSNNEGCIIQDKRGFWRGAISIPSVDGKNKKKYVFYRNYYDQ